MEPYKLRRWKRQGDPGPGRFYTCARPGRSKGKSGTVPDDIVRTWADHLPGSDLVVIVSLLGRKPDGLSEFSFYSFYGGVDTPEERRGALHFAAWLEKNVSGRRFELVEHPTVDFKPVPPATLEQLRSTVEPFFDSDRTVVLVDSGGEGRVRPVCAHLGLIEDTGSYGG